MKYLRIILRRESDLNQLKNVCIAQEEFESFDDFAEYAHSRLDGMLAEIRGKKRNATDEYRSLSDREEES